MTRASKVRSIAASHVLLFVLLCVVASPGASSYEAVLLAAFATLLVFNAVAIVIFLRAFRKTLVPGYPMSFILGSRPEDAEELGAWYWGRASWLTVLTVLGAGFTLWGWTNLFVGPR